MDYTNTIILGLQILCVVLTISLPYLARLIFYEYSAIPYVLMIVLFWIISSLVACVSVITWLDYFYVLIDKGAVS